MGGLAKILGPGVDVMEGNRQSPIAITIDRRQTINVSGSSGIQIGDGSTQIINNGIAEILNQIQQGPGTPKEKEDAKSLLRQFLEHPVVAAIVGGAVGLIK